MKTCAKCKLEKALVDFNLSAKNKDGRHSYCRECSKGHYRTNAVKHKENVSKRKAIHVQRNKEWKWNYLLNSGGCEWDQCNIVDPIMLEFDHKDGEIKVESISLMVNQGLSVKALEKEAKKCRILCANHHRLRTHKQFGWWSLD
jgi:hypothetical protein